MEKKEEKEKEEKEEEEEERRRRRRRRGGEWDEKEKSRTHTISFGLAGAVRGICGLGLGANIHIFFPS